LERDILSGKGKTICGNKHCLVADETLHSYEVNMTYQESEPTQLGGVTQTVTKQALVKVNLCSECAMKLNYKKIKDKLKKKKKHKKNKKNKHKKSKKEEESKDSSS
jgi:protein FRA10AC1